MDPSQIFGDPSQMAAMQQGPQQGPPPSQGGEQEGEPHDAELLDVETSILEAIEAGCDLCMASQTVSSEDYMRFAQGVNFLATALKQLQPAPDPTAGVAIQADQRHAAATLQSATQIHLADLQRQAQDRAAQQQQQASRPGQPQPSARG